MRRPPEVSSDAFPAHLPDLPPQTLMTMDFAVIRPLVRVNGAAIFLRSGAAKFPSLAGSAVGVIGASVYWRPATTFQGRRNGICGPVRLEADGLGQEVGVFAQPIAGALDLDDDGVVKQPVEEGGLDSGAKRNALKKSGFGRLFQARQARLGMAS
jgi:hypothetical protein